VFALNSANLLKGGKKKRDSCPDQKKKSFFVQAPNVSGKGERRASVIWGV